MRSFAKIKHSRNGEITLSFTDKSTCKSCPSGEFLTSQIFILSLFEKIKFSGKFMDLHYFICSNAISYNMYNKHSYVWFCVCTDNNLLAKARHNFEKQKYFNRYAA